MNLGWKLAAVANQWGGLGLTDSYESERQPVARRNTAFARGFAATIGVAPDPEIEDESPAGELARQRAGAYLNAAVRAEFNIPGITFGARYDGSPIIVRDGTSPPPDAANSYTPTACPGGRAPHLWLADGGSIYDKLGFEFTLLRLGPKPAPALGLMQAAKRLGMPLTSLDLESSDLRDLYGADLVLIRPDQIVAWRGAQAPEDPVGLLGASVGFSPSELRI